MRTMRMLATIIGVLALGALGVAPAAAQSAGGDQYGENGEACVKGLLVHATGTLQKPQATSYQYGTHFITDQESGCEYALQSKEVNLDNYVGEKVNITGTTVRGYPVDGGPVLLNVGKIERANSGGGQTGTATLTFELTAEGNVPEDTVISGVYGKPGPNPYAEVPPASDLNQLKLTDPDGDKTYTGSVELKKGDYLALISRTTEAGTEVIHPQSIVQRDATITLDGDRTVSTTFDFGHPPDDSDGSSDNPDNGAAAGSGSGSSEAQYDQPASSDGGGSGQPAPGKDSGGSSGASGSSNASIPVLPDTGGASLLALGAGALLVAGGLIARRITRQL